MRNGKRNYHGLDGYELTRIVARTTIPLRRPVFRVVTTENYGIAVDMPRLPTSLLRRARAIDPLLPALLGPCRELGAAQNELRWLREHVDEVAEARRRKGDRISRISMLADVVQQRASGKPLQYIFGTEFFGDLEICCRPGVLIPRYKMNSQDQRWLLTWL